MEEFILAIAGIGALAIFVVIFTISRLLLIAQPNEVIVLSGRKRTTNTGEVVGYRMIRGGRALKIPMLEKASRMSLNTIPIDLGVANAYSKGGIPLAVQAIANIKINSTEPSFGNAVERFLNRSEAEIHQIAKDTLEGNLRGILATLTPEEVNEDRLKFAESLMEEAETDLNKLGLLLDTLKITNISDESDYLNSIGRVKTAEVITRARIAEADRKAEAEETEANAMQRAEKAKAIVKLEIERARIEADQNIAVANANKLATTLEADSLSLERAEKAKTRAKQEIEKAQIETEQNIAIANANRQAATLEAEAFSKERAEKAKAVAEQNIQHAKIESEQSVKVKNAQANTAVEVENNAFRIKKAELEKVAIIKEKEAEVAGQKAKVLYEQELEEERIILQQKRLMADVIEPARAEKEAMELKAKGEAASIIADGSAEIEILLKKIQAYLSAGSEGNKIFMLNMLPQITEMLTSVVKDIKIDKISVIENGNSGEQTGLSKLINQLPGSVVSLSEMIENATGVDILSAMKDKSIK